MAADAQVTDMLSDLLKNLEPLSKQLNTASDELTQTLQIFQDQINALGVGLEVWAGELRASDWRDVLDRDNAPTGAREYTAEELGYGRLGDGWALLVRQRRYVEDDQHSSYPETSTYQDDPYPKPLLRASRELRAAAIALIPELIKSLETEAKTVIARVEQAKKIADSLK